MTTEANQAIGIGGADSDDQYLDGIPCMMMRGGTSRGAYFLATDLPADPHQRDDMLLRIVGSGHPLQIDGIGGGNLLSSKVAVVSLAPDDDADVNYLFLQLGVEEATITDRQNCGNILAGVGPFVVERGLFEAGPVETTVRIRMLNSDSIVSATFSTPNGRVNYRGVVAIAGSPGTAAPVILRFSDTAGSATSGLLPTGHLTDVIDGIEVTCVDNGMPVVVARAADFGVTGDETYDELGEDSALAARIQSLRIKAGELMGLGDVTNLSVPKTTLVAAPRDGGAFLSRTFIPVRLHASIGVLGAVSAATSVLLLGGVGSELAVLPTSGHLIDVEHLSGHTVVDVDIDATTTPPTVVSAGNVRTARKLFDGIVFPAPYSPARVV